MARVPHQGGRPLDPGDAAINMVLDLPKARRFPGDLDGIAVIDAADRRGIGRREVGLDVFEYLERDRDQAIIGLDGGAFSRALVAILDSRALGMPPDCRDLARQPNDGAEPPRE